MAFRVEHLLIHGKLHKMMERDNHGVLKINGMPKVNNGVNPGINGRLDSVCHRVGHRDTIGK